MLKKISNSIKEKWQHFRQRMGSQNPNYQAYLKDYQRYRHLPQSMTNPTSLLRWSSYVFWIGVIWGAAAMLGLMVWKIALQRNITGSSSIDVVVGMWVCAILAILLFLAGLALIASIIKVIYRWRTFLADSQLTQGTIIGKWDQASVGSDALFDHYLAVQFLNGRFCRVEVNPTQFDRAKVGQTIQMRYLPNQSEVCYMIPDSNN